MKQSVINTLNRVGLNYTNLDNEDKNYKVVNRFGGGSCETTELIAFLIKWVYRTSNDYEMGISKVRVDDFDRIRYYILEKDNNAYMTCLD